MQQKDNSTFALKRRLRLSALRLVADAVILETHGGIGKLYASCYSTRPQGIVFEKDPAKADFLASQRPTWSVYQSDVLSALRGGAGNHLPVNFIDLDPYGSPWEILRAFFQSARPMPSPLLVVVNDGLRQKLQLGGAWHVELLKPKVQKYGNARMYKMYKAICRELLEETVCSKGYSIQSWTAYHCGAHNAMTHFAALLAKPVASTASNPQTNKEADRSPGQNSRRPITLAF